MTDNKQIIVSFLRSVADQFERGEVEGAIEIGYGFDRNHIAEIEGGEVWKCYKHTPERKLTITCGPKAQP